MGGNGGEHHLQRVANALESSGASLKCSSCGHDQWARVPKPLVLKETESVSVDEVGVPIGGELVGGVPAYALICKRCGYMRLHSVKYLLGGEDASGQ